MSAPSHLAGRPAMFPLVLAAVLASITAVSSKDLTRLALARQLANESLTNGCGAADLSRAVADARIT